MVTAATAPLYAGFLRRAAALCLDTIILYCANWIVMFMVLGANLTEAWAWIVLALHCLYFSLFHGSAKQATPGKLAFRIKVTDLQGNRIGLLRAVLRYFAAWLSAALLLLGYLLAAVDSRKRALHDMICGTLVVNREATAGTLPSPGATMPLTLGVVATVVIAVITPLGLAAVAIPAYREFNTRARVVEAVAVGAELRAEIADARRANQPLKVGRVESVRSRQVREAIVAPSGVITVRLKSDVADGGSIIFTPITDSGGQIAKWTCHGDGVPEKYLPAMCRKP